MSEDHAPDPETVPVPLTDRLPRLRAALRDASELLVCLDFDGTLAPIVEDPDAATATVDNEAALESLTAAPSVSTAIVSGRSLADVRSRVSGPDVYAGNHGLELARDGAVSIHPVAEKRASTIDEVCAALETVLEPIPNCAVENKRLTGTIHVRSVPRAGREVVRRHVRRVVDRFGHDGLSLSTGKAVYEISPAISWGKGDAVELIEGACPEETFVLYLGDDVTDESAFRAIQPEGMGIHVGNGTSHAAARLDSPEEVASFLHWLADTGVELVSDDRDRTQRAVMTPAR